MRYWHVQYYDPNKPIDHDCPDHNAVVSSFDEAASLSSGRIMIVMGEATEQEYLDELAARKA